MTKKGVLKVTVIEAKNLKDEDKIGKSDPYVTLNIGESTQKTTVKGGDLNPTYNEEFLFDIDGQKALKIEVWDKDHLNKDDLIGKNDVKLAHAISKGSEDVWVTMREHTIGRSRGEVHLSLEFTAA
ncbi:18567_t:CDS:2 [Funneliformis geosporum]|uniref:10294_t:CDS:1 n=1 Tax=Funneliformis geosporum TaxID=1117311 RepID=A0A9W4SEF7_9GLOM|nr:18567_t:CDS:2 [Funneliformis geosporum]CAI2166586.1 10294_t:CDS:2 [Funneliformis geosporum]